MSATDHLPPWRWDMEFANGRAILRDRDGRWLVVAECDNHLAFFSPRVRALTEAAPEMEQRLLAALDLILRIAPFAFSGAGGPAMPTKVEVDNVYRAGRELLARIDERSKEGT